jgi:hypothetical protein
MAQVRSVADLATMEDGEAILAVRGTLVKVYEHKAGESKNGAYSFQNATLKDKTGSATVKFKDVADKAHLRGKEVLLQCIKTEKGSFTGVKIKDETFKDKTTRFIWVTPSADIGLAEENGNGHGHDDPKPQPRQPERAPKEQQSSQPQSAPLQTLHDPQPNGEPDRLPANASKPLPGSREAVLQVAAWATQVANLQLMAITKVEKYLAPMVEAKLGIRLDSGARHAWAMNLMIQLADRSVGSHWNLPMTEYAMPKQSEQTDSYARRDDMRCSTYDYEPGQEG